MVILYYVIFVPSYYILTEGYKSHTQTLVSGAKGSLSARKPRIRENQKYPGEPEIYVKNLPRLSGGLLKTRVVLHEKIEKNIGSGPTSGSVRIDR